MDANALTYLMRHRFGNLIPLTMQRALEYESNIKLAASWLIMPDMREIREMPSSKILPKIPTLKKAGEILVEKLGDMVPNLSDELNAGKKARNRVVHELASLTTLFMMMVADDSIPDKMKEVVESIIPTDIRDRLLSPMEKYYKVSQQLLLLAGKTRSDISRR